MNILTKIKSIIRSRPKSDYGNVVGNVQDNSPCTVNVILSKSEFALFSKFYIRGMTSYRSIFRFIFMGRFVRMSRILNKIGDKAAKGCPINNTFVRFFFDKTYFIEIPFDVFSQKKDINFNILKTYVWHKRNELRILKVFPEYVKYENTLVNESDIINLLGDNLNG